MNVEKLEKIKEKLQKDLDALRNAPTDKDARREFVRTRIGDAEAYISNLLIELRKV